MSKEEKLKSIDLAIKKQREKKVISKFLEKRGNKHEWKTLRAKDGSVYTLTKEDLEMIDKFTKGKCVDDSIEHFPKYVDSFSSIKKTVGIVRNKPTRNTGTAYEDKKANKLAKKNQINLEEQSSDEDNCTDIWGTGENIEPKYSRIPMPENSFPQTSESYNPPEEALFDERRLQEWYKMAPSERPTSYIPQKVSALRKISKYENYSEELYIRSLDLYLSPREESERLNIDPGSLIPNAQDPESFRPFPDRVKERINGHTGKVNSISVDQEGQWILTGGDDCILKLWELETGLCSAEISLGEKICCISWFQRKKYGLVVVGLVTKMIVLRAGKCYKIDEIKRKIKEKKDKSKDVVWSKETEKRGDLELLCTINVPGVFHVDWHHKKKEFVSCSKGKDKNRIAVHRLDKCETEFLFSGSKKYPSWTSFHPSEDRLLVVTNESAELYEMRPFKKIKAIEIPRNIPVSNMSINKEGNVLCIGSYDKGVYSVNFGKVSSVQKLGGLKIDKAMALSQEYPLFACDGDKGTVNLFHITYVDRNTVIKPIKKILINNTIGNYEITECVFHPKHPWMIVGSNTGEISIYI
eukprot:GHVP01009747.1.p1 GENE.GHVP01009747.1~~GHVP01009747.1.p1  ORF type:complete len:634 (+),score=122.93 GHVP01009747.1:160-1902(+)